MAVLPSPTLVAGQNYAVYEAWYQHVDPKHLGSIGALDAANFLKKSGLSSSILSKIWDLSDPYGRGYLDRDGFFISLKLVAVAQSGLEISNTNLSLETSPPNMGEEPPVIVQSGTPAASSPASFATFPTTSPVNSGSKTIHWSWTVVDKTKYDTLFDSLNPVGEKLPGSKVREVLLNSTLPMETLGKIWDLADIDNDGALDRHEFAVAMHLVYKVLDNYPLPVSLPLELLPPDVQTRRGSTLAGAVNVLPAQITPPQVVPVEAIKETPPNGACLPWVVCDADKKKYDALFLQADMDHDGYVSGMEIKDLFLQSRLPQPVLAHIWNLCDIGQTGKLSMEQFALSMWLVQQKVQGKELPASLTPEMMPPSLRAKESNGEELAHSAEMDQISKEIELLVKEKRQLETEIAQKEADIKIKNSEIRSLQSELDTLTATLKQLEIQKREAQKRLDDLDTQRLALEQDLQGVERQIDEHEKQVRTFRAQAEEQEKVLRTQEAEVASKKQELSDVRSEELRMEQQMQATRLQLDKLEQTLQDTHLQIGNVKGRIEDLQKSQQRLNDAVAAYDDALTNEDASQLSDSLLRAMTPPVTSSSDLGVSPSSERAKAGLLDSDPFSSQNGTASRAFSTSSNSDSFDNTDFFSSRNQSSTLVDPFASKDPFSSAFGPATKTTADPFAAAFGHPKAEVFDAFSNVHSSAADPFGSDPFTAAATRVESPTPALPPKKSKQPPPRPAPPKAAGAKAPQRPAPPVSAAPKSPQNCDPFNSYNDPFASAAKDPFGAGGFADFASFDTKLTPSAIELDLWPHESSGSSNSTKMPEDGVQQQHRYAEFEFTVDPFKDVGFSDPFAANLEDPFTGLTSTEVVTVAVATATGDKSTFDPFSGEEDPFSSPKSKIPFDNAFSSSSNWNGRSDPFSSSDPSFVGWESEFSSSDVSHTKSPTPVASSTLKNKSWSSTSSKGRTCDTSPKLSEDAQMAWAAAESVRLEKERRRKADIQEKADLEMAIALSKSQMQPERQDAFI